MIVTVHTRVTVHVMLLRITIAKVKVGFGFQVEHHVVVHVMEHQQIKLQTKILHRIRKKIANLMDYALG